MRITQRTIADSLCLSVATVSRSLNNHPDIDPQTRSRVLQVAQKVGYRHNRNRKTSGSRQNGQNPSSPKRPQSLALQMIMRHGTEVSDTRSAVSARVLSGVSEQANLLEYGLDIRHAMVQDADMDEAISITPFVDPTADGCLVLGRFSSESLTELARTKACVAITEYDPRLPVDCIAQDNHQSMSLLVDHLRQLGHQRLGFVSVGWRHHAYRSRYAALLEDAVDHDIAINPDDMVGVHERGLPFDDNVDRVARQIRDGVTAFICVNDLVGYRLMAGLIDRHGIEIPRDVSICGFDALQPQLRLPKLTTVTSPFEDMGFVAVRRLAQRLTQLDAPCIRLMFACQLQVGQSTASPTPTPTSHPTSTPPAVLASPE